MTPESRRRRGYLSAGTVIADAARDLILTLADRLGHGKAAAE